MGFWSTIAGGLTSLIPGVGPLLAPLAAGAVGALTGGSGPNGSGSATAAQTAAQNATRQGSTAATTGNQDLAAGSANLGAAGDSYRTALNGSQEQLQALLGPEINTVMSQYDNAAKTAATFGPRGGGRTAVMGELPFAKAGAAGGLISKARSEAASGASEVGGKEGAIGAQLSGQATSQLGPSLAPGMQQAGFKNTNDLALGTGIGKILGNIFANKNGGSGNADMSIPVENGTVD